MKNILVTGGAGFIGSNFIHYMLQKHDYKVVNLDALTYAGNLENLKAVKENPKHIFIHGDICDANLVTELFGKYDFNYVINFAAESHVDRSIETPDVFVKTNVLGTLNLLNAAKKAWNIDSEYYRKAGSFYRCPQMRFTDLWVIWDFLRKPLQSIHTAHTHQVKPELIC